ncbi:phasin [Methylorubrum extorquens]|uniref:phasin family protein n=1 Tax=Methylorubrum extorquens TaxID=408 RepID=UPI0022371A26|nr:phasin [Methylorubrum extorquens]UYW26433.1 phasin [Methylorubrum extorquens]
MNITQPSFQIPAEMRDSAEKSVEQARAALIAFMQNARKATESVQAQTRAAELPVSVAYVRGLELFEYNLAATFDVAQKLVRASSLQDALQIQSEYVHAQFASLQSQAKELISAAQPAKAA